jgi:hypothetical protein
MKTALCLMTRDQSDYLPEWIGYHEKIGFDEFIIYDNNSKIPITSDKSNVIVKLWDTEAPGRQVEAYTDCLNHYKEQYDWLGFIDTDEFIVPNKTNNIKDILVDYEDFGGLGINWYMFGSNGLKERPESQLTGFTKRSDTDNCKYAIKALTPHSFEYMEGYYCVDENMNKINASYTEKHSANNIQINHYYTRSEQEFKEKVQRGRGNAPMMYRISEFRLFDLTCNYIEDTRAKDLWLSQ